MRAWSFVLGAGLALPCLSGCRTLDRFDTGDGESYCGNIVSAAFVREGFAPDLRIRVEIDTSKLESTPGSITSNDAAKGPCAPAPTFDNAPFLTNDAIFHDQLSTLDFGEGRDANFVAWVQPSCGGAMLAVVSLMKNNDVEVRLMKAPVPAAGTTPETPSGFGLFQLSRLKTDACF